MTREAWHEHTPALALAALSLTLAAYLWWAIAKRALGHRPILLLSALLAAVPALYVTLTWARLVDERHLRIERPGLAYPVALLIIVAGHRLLRLSPRQGAARRALTELMIMASALGAGLATIGLELGKSLDHLAVITALDRSRSIELVPSADARMRAELQVAENGMREDDRIGTIAFAAEATVEDPLRPRTRLPAPQKAELGRDGTDIGAAIRRALAEVPADAAARIVLITDGVNTRGNPLDAAAAAVAAGVPVDSVPLDQTSLTDVRVVAVRMPPRAYEGEALELRIVTQSSAPAQLEIRIHRDGELIRKGHASVLAGEDVLRMRELAMGPGLHRYDVEISALDPKLDQAPEDNRGSTFVRVRGKALALVMEKKPELAEALVRSLESAAFAVKSVGPAGVPADLAEFAAYDVVVLSDIPASDLAPTQIQALASYVRDLGGGLVLMGGDRSMGPGGYAKTPIEDVSPVSFDLKQERRRASLAEVIAIDYSGSMAVHAGKNTKLELANEAAVRSAELLGAGDRLGVMHVDTVVSWTVPLAPVVDRAAIARQIRAVGPGGGGIYVDLTLEAAYSALGRETVNLKHLLLFADGSDAEERQRAFALVSAAKARGITTSVVSLGRGGDTSALEHMSRLGDGRFYLIEDASRLPAVFAQETVLAAKSSINEVVFHAAAGAPGPAIRGIDWSASPSLSGYVVTIPKGRAQVHLRAAEGDPLLATWSIGIGRAAAFTSDFKDRWGVRWTSWDGASRLFGQLAKDVARREDDARVRLEADASGGELHVRATVVDDDGKTESFRRLKVRVGGPDGYSSDLALEAVGAGSYAAKLPLSRPGAYIATALDELSGEPVGTTGAVLSAGEELRPTGSDRALLARIAQLTGGKLRDTLAGVFDDREHERFAYKSLTPLLLPAAAVLLLLGVAARRFAVPDAVLALFARWSRLKAERRDRGRAHAARQAEQAAEHAENLEALQRAKSRSASTTERRPPPEAPPPSAPRFARAAPTAVAHPPLAPPAPGAADAAPAPRPLSSAEILLARRRGRRS